MDTNKTNSIVLHRNDGSLIHFTPCSKGLYRYALQHKESLNKFWSMISTVAENAKQFTKRQYRNAILARRVQNIIMRPGNREFMDISINHIRNCPINKQHIQMAESIFGPNLGSLKGKTTYHAPPHVVGHITPVPHEILAAHRNIHLTVDIMYINKLPFLITYSRSLRFGTVEFLDNRQTPTIQKNYRASSTYTTIVVLPSPNYSPIPSLEHYVPGFLVSTLVAPVIISPTLNASSVL